METKENTIFKQVNEWFIENDNKRVQMKNEAYKKIQELVATFGKDNGNNKIIFNFAENDMPCIMDYCGFDGEAYPREIQFIEMDKEYGGMALVYGDLKYEYIKFSDTTLSDRMYLLNEMLYLINNN